MELLEMSDALHARLQAHDEKLQAHEARSQERYEKLCEKVETMSGVEDKVNIHLGGDAGGSNTAALLAAMGNRGAGMEAVAPMMAAMAGGGGFGGNNGIWPIVLLALLGRNGGGLFGGTDGAGGTVANQLQASIDTNAIMQNLSALQAAVPLGACQTTNAVQAAANDTNSQLLQQTIGLTSQIDGAKAAGVAAANQNALMLTSGFANVGDKIDGVSTQQAVGFGVVNTNIERNGWAVTQAISADGEKTRALISSIDRDNLNRIITTQANEITELNAEGRARENRHGIEITMTNNQNQNQLQFQAQAQVLNALSSGLLDAIQNIRATNQAINIGAGTQTANPTNTNTNVRT